MNYDDPFVNIWVNQGVHSEAMYPARPKSNSTYPSIDVFVIMLENPFNESTYASIKQCRKTAMYVLIVQNIIKARSITANGKTLYKGRD